MQPHPYCAKLIKSAEMLNLLLDHPTSASLLSSILDEALYFAARNVRVEMVKELIKRGANVNAVHFEDNETPLLAVNSGWREDDILIYAVEETIEVLVNARACMGVVADTTSPFHNAIANGYSVIAKKFIQLGAMDKVWQLYL